MKTVTIQEDFFRQIKQKLPSHLSMADEIATLLNISQDSAYRRIRGEKPLTIDEIQLLAVNYSISLDSFMNIKTESFVFTGLLIDKETYVFKNYYHTLAFVNATAWISHRENHHPDIQVGYNKCIVSYSTHAIDGLSENDFICAAKIDMLFEL